jgi:phosphate transport system protein
MPTEERGANLSAIHPPAHHTSHDFDVEMSDVREALAAMAARCRKQLHLALEAFWSGSTDMMDGVEASDRAVDHDEKSIDALVLQVLALRQPVASDLRALIASLKVVTDLERIGDEAVDLARTGCVGVSSFPDGDRVQTRLQHMTETTEKALARAVGAFFDSNREAAVQVHLADRAIDAMYDAVCGDAVAFIPQHPTQTAAALSVITVAKCLERIGAHAANIAHWTLFVLDATAPIGSGSRVRQNATLTGGAPTRQQTTPPLP